MSPGQGGPIGSQCTVCAHTDIGTINRALRTLEPRRALARRFSLGHDSLNRHFHSKHEGVVDPKLVSGIPVDPGSSPREKVQAIITLLEKKVTAGNIRTDEIRELRISLSELDKMQGGDAPTSVTLQEVAGLKDFLTDMMLALEPFPEAREALAVVLTKHGLV